MLVLVAALLAALGTARLGFWQLDRAQQKLDLQARLQARAVLPPLSPTELPGDAAAAQAQYDRPVQLRGRWLSEHTLYLDNRQMNARQGFYVLTPLRLPSGDAVLVQRGWMPRDFAVWSLRFGHSVGPPAGVISPMLRFRSALILASRRGSSMGLVS